MTTKQVKNAINGLKKQGMKNEDIAKALYNMYSAGKIDLEQLDILIKNLGYSLNDSTFKNKIKPKSEEKAKISEYADKGLELCQNGELKRGIKFLRLAAEKGDVLAITNLGHALNLIGDYNESFKWTLKAAEMGNETSMLNLSIMYRVGQGTKCNVEEAVKWGREIVNLGNIDDGYNLIVSAYRYASNKKLRDDIKAFKYALEGSKMIMRINPEPNPHDECETIIQLALCYDFGIGTIENKKEALKYYDYCCKCRLGVALYNSACIYAYGKDKELNDIDKAIKYFKLATTARYADAFYQLGILYQKGEKVEENIELAKYYYARAIRLGNGEQHYEETVDLLKELSKRDAERVLSGKYSLIID